MTAYGDIDLDQHWIGSCNVLLSDMSFGMSIMNILKQTGGNSDNKLVSINSLKFT